MRNLTDGQCYRLSSVSQDALIQITTCYIVSCIVSLLHWLLVFAKSCCIAILNAVTQSARRRMRNRNYT